MRKAKEQVKITLRLPQEAKSFIERQATSNFTSENSEIVRCIRAEMRRAETVAAVPAE